MTILKDFLYFITDANGRSYYVYNGVVSTSATPKPLEVSPDGWQTTSVKFGRNDQYHGILRSFTTPLKFVKEGAEILKYLFFTQGSEASARLVIHRVNKSFGGKWRHELFYTGDLDFSKIEISDYYVDINVMEGGLAKLFKANDKTVYEIPVDVPEARLIQMDGLNLTYRNLWATIAERLELKDNGIFGPTKSEFFPITLSDATVDSRHLNFVVNKENLTEIGGSVGNFEESTAFFAATLTALDIRIKCKLKFQIGTFPGVIVENSLAKLELRGKAGNVIREFFSVDPPDGLFEQSYTIDINEVITVPADERLFFGFRLDVRRRIPDVLPASIVAVLNEQSTFEVEYITKYKTTFVKGLPLPYVFSKLLENMVGVGTPYTFSSSYLPARWSGLLLSSFDAVRGIADAKIKISFSKLFDSVNVPCNISASILGNTLSVEDKASAYQTTVVANMGEVVDYSIKPAEEYLCNTIRIGYPELKTEDFYLRDEFNCQHIYSSSVKKSVKELTLVSEVHASMYAIEFARYEANNKTGSSNIDNQNCFILTDVDPTVGAGDDPPIYYRLHRRPYSSITGTLAGNTAFNVELSPKRCLKMHGDYLRALFFWQYNTQLIFVSSDRNAELSTTYLTSTITEKASIDITDFALPLFAPVIISGKGLTPKNLVDSMFTNPNSSVVFSIDGESYKGFILDVGIQPATNSSQEFTALLHSTTDFSKLL